MRNRLLELLPFVILVAFFLLGLWGGHLNDQMNKKAGFSGNTTTTPR